MEPVPVLNVVEGPLAGQTFEINATGLCIGREPTNEIVVTDAGVSRQHARILLHNGMIWVQDVGSRNGVFVNGNRVPDHKQVKPGDKVTVGINIFVLAMQERIPTRPSLSPAAPPARNNLVPLAVAGFGVLLGLATIFWWLRS